MNKKLDYWQGIRGICIIAVILIHCTSGADYASFKSFEGFYYFIERNLISFPVAVFFTLSGYFLPNDKSSNIIGKRLKRLLIPYFVYSFSYILFRIITGENLTILQIIKCLLTGSAATPLYYIFVLALFTIITPLLFKCIHSRKLSILIIGITPIIQFIAYVLSLAGYNIWEYLKYTFVWIAFYYGGMLIREHNIKFNLKVSLFLLPIAFILELVETSLLVKSYTAMAYSQMRFSNFFYAAVLIMLVYSINQKKPTKIPPQSLIYIGDRSYGIFYIHAIFITAINFLLSYFNLNLSLPVLHLIQLSFALTASLFTIKMMRLIFKDKIAKRIFGV